MLQKIYQKSMIQWQLCELPVNKMPLLLDEISEFRGKILYENGRRPIFKNGNGFSDPDVIDNFAYHLLGRDNQRIIGYVRLLPVDTGCLSMTEKFLNPLQFRLMLTEFGSHKREIIEGGRWLVEPSYRSSNLAISLAIGGISIAKQLGFKCLICPVGTKHMQHRILASIGLREVPNLPLITIQELDDEVRIMYVNLQEHLPNFEEFAISSEGLTNILAVGKS